MSSLPRNGGASMVPAPAAATSNVAYIHCRYLSSVWKTRPAIPVASCRRSQGKDPVRRAPGSVQSLASAPPVVGQLSAGRQEVGSYEGKKRRNVDNCPPSENNAPRYGKGGRFAGQQIGR